MKMVKTLFLTNRQRTKFYLFITEGDKPFKTKEFSQALDIARVSFADEEHFHKLLQTEIGAAAIYSAIVDPNQMIQIVIDQEVTEQPYYGCSDGTTRGYMKVKTEDILKKFLPKTGHQVQIIEV